MNPVFLLFFSFGLFASPFSQDINGTFRDAAKEKKSILIDFYGIWCPPCNGLDETVFETTAFLNKAKGFKLLKVDADSPDSWAIKSRYKVGGYPTVLFVNQHGKEIYRVTGYRPLPEFLRIMEMVSAAKGKNFSSSCKSKRPDDLWRCAVSCSELKDVKCIQTALKKLEPLLSTGTATYEMARTLAVENAANDDLKRNGYEQLMKEFPSSPLALMWASAYFDLLQGPPKLEPQKELIEAVLANYQKAFNDPRKDEMGIPQSDMAQIRADLLEKLGKPEESKHAWKEAAKLLESFSKSLPAGAKARGFTLERIGCLENAGEISEALHLANTYRKFFPEEFTFHYSAANLLERQKKYSESLEVAKESLKYSYGDNKIRVATLLMRLYAATGNKEAASSLYESVNKEFNPSSNLEVRTHRYLIKLQETYRKTHG